MTVCIETLWNELSIKLKRFIIRRITDESLADDILQEVFLRIQTHANTLNHADKLESWIYQITRNVIADYFRRRKDEIEVPETFPFFDDNLEDDLAAELAPCLRSMVDNLPAKYREALILTEYEGYTQSDLADILGISFSGAKSRVQRAKEHLKEMLLECCHFEFDRLGQIIDYYPYCDKRPVHVLPWNP
jgi:RNA polymerase sigma-70 factor (ECF subfamily)